MELVSRTDTGEERPHNEDAVWAETLDGWAVLVVADGMGGHSAGDVASQSAIESFVEFIHGKSDDEAGEVDEDGQTADAIESNGGAETPLAANDSQDVLRNGIETANATLQAMVEEDHTLHGMGTTFVGAVIRDGNATIANVGDSRAYHVTDHDIEQVTTDQSLVQQLVEQGTIEPENADDHPQRHVLAQALGTDETVAPDFYDLDLDGTLLLCSDGLSDEVPDEDIHEIITENESLEESAGKLVDRANELDGSDNISVVLARESASESGGVGSVRKRLSRLRRKVVPGERKQQKSRGARRYTARTC